jgi:hypothetical protein
MNQKAAVNRYFSALISRHSKDRFNGIYFWKKHAQRSLYVKVSGKKKHHVSYQLEYIFRKFHDEQRIFDKHIIQYNMLTLVIKTLFI